MSAIEALLMVVNYDGMLGNIVDELFSPHSLSFVGCVDNLSVAELDF